MASLLSSGPAGTSRAFFLCVVALGLGACGGDSSPAPNKDAGEDGPSTGEDGDVNDPDGDVDDTDWPAITGPFEWATETMTSDNGTVVCFDITYESDGLTIGGQYCRPKAAGTYPILMVNHGLQCYRCENPTPRFAALGYAAFESMYRGEETSDGEIELCTGEVSDVRKMLAIAKTLDFVDPERVGMIGFSHGGCITTKTMIAEFETNGPGSLDAVVNVFGPSNFVDVHELWQWRVDNVCPNPLLAELCAVSQANIAFLEDVMGGGPEETPATYAQHGTVRLASRIDAVDSPYLLMHGVQDLVVPVVNNCELAAALDGVEAWHFDAGGSLTTARPGKGIFSNPGDCAGIDNAWKNADAPTTSYGDRTFIVYDNAGHDASSNQGVEFFNRAAVFLGERLDP